MKTAPEPPRGANVHVGVPSGPPAFLPAYLARLSAEPEAGSKTGLQAWRLTPRHQSETFPIAAWESSL